MVLVGPAAVTVSVRTVTPGSLLSVHEFVEVPENPGVVV